MDGAEKYDLHWSILSDRLFPSKMGSELKAKYYQLAKAVLKRDTKEIVSDARVRRRKMRSFNAPSAKAKSLARKQVKGYKFDAEFEMRREAELVSVGEWVLSHFLKFLDLDVLIHFKFL